MPAAVVFAGASAPVLAVLAAGGLTEAALTDGERDRADAFHFATDRTDFVAAHLLVRYGVGRHTGLPATEVMIQQRCDECGETTHGRPTVPGVPVRLSWAHGRGYVAAAAAAVPIGVDVERQDRPDGAADLAGLYASALAPREVDLVRAAPDPGAAFRRFWVRKEAAVKLGLATLDTLCDLDLSALGLATGAARWDGLHLLDWTDLGDTVAGAAVSTDPPVLTRLG
ncbi:MAG TPA: 4'-phosphopantetheinyl transferase superfamily protein [Mycobacteriales bacterium]|nr:4'-phosphopantetheinyl transferase superfamily protein [Mycobacteriales bacterium]